MSPKNWAGITLFLYSLFIDFFPSFERVSLLKNATNAEIGIVADMMLFTAIILFYMPENK